MKAGETNNPLDAITSNTTKTKKMRKPKNPAIIEQFKEKLTGKRGEIAWIAKVAEVDPRTVEFMKRGKRTPIDINLNRILIAQETYLRIQEIERNAVNDFD
jgi:hypothetical protein